MVAELIDVPAGAIFLKDEGTRDIWRVEFEAFQLARFPVTGDDSRLPLTDVSWLDAIAYCNQLSLTESLRPAYAIDGSEVEWDRAADGYRLPTEAEWEYACRAGTTGPQYGVLEEIAWYEANSAGAVHEVGGLRPNDWGFHDMLGNVWEWTWDLYDPAVYGPYRVFRGGGAYDPPRACRASCRRKSHPTFHIDDLGFRLARN
jgi:formylglycine-generating enzyme required for sulfatase activity